MKNVCDMHIKIKVTNYFLKWLCICMYVYVCTYVCIIIK